MVSFHGTAGAEGFVCKAGIGRLIPFYVDSQQCDFVPDMHPVPGKCSGNGQYTYTL